MAAGKEFPLSVVIRAVDKITAPVSRINRKLTAFTTKLTAPVRKLGASLGALNQAMGFPKMAAGFGRVGRALGGVIDQVKTLTLRMAAMFAAATVAVTAFVRSLINGGDQLNDLRNQTGISAQAIGELQYALGQSGVEAGESAGALRKMTVSLGQLKNNTGALYNYLKKTNPELLRQLKTATTTEEKMNLLVNALDKTTDAEQRAALGAAAFGRGVGVKMAGALKDGTKSLEQMREEFRKANPNLDDFATQSDAVNDSIGRLTMGLNGMGRRAILPLLPMFEKLAGMLGDYMLKNGEKVQAWAENFAVSLPGRLRRLRDSFMSLVESIRENFLVNFLVERYGVLNTVVGAVALVIAGPLIASLISAAAAMTQLAIATAPVLIRLGALIVLPVAAAFMNFVTAIRAGYTVMQAFNLVLIANPIGVIIMLIGALAAAAYLIWKNWSKIVGFFSDLWDGVKAAFGSFLNWVRNIDWLGLFVKVLSVGPTILGWLLSPFRALVQWVTGIDWFGILGNKIKNVLKAILPDWLSRRLASGNYQEPSASPQPMTGAQSAAPAPSNGPQSKAEVTVNFSNAPKGTRVSQERRSTADVKTNLGLSTAGSAD